MKVRTDIVKMYKEIHGWVGIVSGLALFIAFYAGAITMFEEPLQRWATPPAQLAPPVPLERTQELIDRVLAAHPEAADDYQVHLQTGPERPARMTWETDLPGGGGHHEHEIWYAALSPDGALQVTRQGPSPVAELVDVLHQQVGLPFPHEVAMPIMGAVALLYTIAIVSGLIVLLPSLVKDLFAVRIGRNVKRMWLDVHNVLGLFSLPFHLIMALTAIIFAFHDQFYDAQGAAFGGAPPPEAAVAGPAPEADRSVLGPMGVTARLAEQAPGFQPVEIGYGVGRNGIPTVRVSGRDERYGLRGPTLGFAELDPYTGDLTGTDYMPGHQDGWSATVTSFFALHFGNFGGAPVRWSYFLLGIAGAFLFYTGNLLWIESRRRRERKAGAVQQTRSTKVLAVLTVGVPLGCVAGISVTIAAAKPFGASATEGLHSVVYYAVFLAFTGWALVRGASRAGSELLAATALAALSVPATTLLTMGLHPPVVPIVDFLSLILAFALLIMFRRTALRARGGPADSVWANTPQLAATQQG
ncbi:PepSY-associated TM helix domain-containing protein [Pacificimonas flava]|uniref:Putative iron-regulated membrane protein n=1 Tax=Pacificimonas flava TaxID=1234595 RepID=M2SD70_9SPHN|nr:PepSY-associated TM helix domain-containing protein [Pacificimonas flava]EMD83300.1 putative iron-regulated membrane protein [Pacificimonas flava]MBB5279140.1 putative iron-regulated membrane protein [Pacificimonas flava]